MSESKSIASSTSQKKKPALVASLTMPDGSTEQVEISDPSPPQSPIHPNKRKTVPDTKAGPSKLPRPAEPLHPPVTHDSVACMVAAAVSAALPPEFIQCVSAFMAQPDPIARSGKGEAKQLVDRSVIPAATGSEGLPATEVAAPKVGDVGVGTSSLMGSGYPATDITATSTLERPSVTSASPLEAGSRSAHQGAFPVASSATWVCQDGQEAQWTSGTPVLPAPGTLSSGKSLPPPRVYTTGTASGLHQGRPPVDDDFLTLPVGHVGAHPGNLRASGGHDGSSHLGDQLPTADFRFRPRATTGSGRRDRDFRSGRSSLTGRK